MNHGKLNGLEDTLRKLGARTIHIEILPESYYVEYIKNLEVLLLIELKELI